MLNKKALILILFIKPSFLVIAQEWEQSFAAGSFDVNGSFMGGSEVLQLVAHKSKLFASVGYWQDENNVWYGGDDLEIGWSQILCLENDDDSWIVDFDLGYNYLRPEILKQVVFTKDNNGILLSVPDTLLIVGAYSPNYISGVVTANIFVRDDLTSSWSQTLVYEHNYSSDESYSMRDIEIHTDQVTGIENLIISVGTQGIFSGKYNPNLDGKIEMNLVPEIGPLGIRPLGITIANNNLYFSSGNKIFKRNDGLDPNYEVVHNFNDLTSNINPAVGGIRGLSTIHNPSGTGESMILMWCPDGQSKGTIYRLDPVNSQEFDRVYEIKISLLVEDYLIGETVSYVLGAYNEFYPFTDPSTNFDYHIIGIESLLQENIYPSWNGFYSGGIIILRDDEGSYYLQEINDTIDLDESPLVSVRCYVESPFENEKALYIGGFDPNGHTSTNKAWIYKKYWNDLDVVRQNVESMINFEVYNNYPNPFNLSTDITFSILREGFVNITVYNTIGQKINSLVNKFMHAGNYSIKWTAENQKNLSLPSGIYFYSIQSNSYRKTKKMILIK